MLFHGFYPKMLRDCTYPVKLLRITIKPQHISAGLLSAISLSPGSAVLGAWCRAPGDHLRWLFVSNTFSLVVVVVIVIVDVVVVWALQESFWYEENLSPLVFFWKSLLCHLILFPEGLGFCQMIYINTHIFWSNDNMKPYEQVHKHREYRGHLTKQQL